MRQVKCFDDRGRYLCTYNSIVEASEQTGADYEDIRKTCRREKRMTEDERYYFRYVNEWKISADDEEEDKVEKRMMKKKKLFPRYSDGVNTKMESAYAYVTRKQGGKLESSQLIILEQLADLLNIYEMTYEEFMKQGVMVIDFRGNNVRNPLIKQLLDISVQIQKISHNMGFDLKASTTINDLEDEEDELIEKLSNL